MDAVLIIVGVLLLAGGWLWLSVTAWRQSSGHFIAALLAAPLLLLVRGRGFALWPRLLLLLGLLLMGGGLWWLHEQQPERFDALISGAWYPAEKGTQTALHGRLMGQAFHPTQAFWAGQDLILEERDTHRLRRSLRLRFSTLEQLPETGLQWLPGDAGPWPEVVMQWHDGALSVPGWRQVSDPYTLIIQPLGQRHERLTLDLRLPATYQTWVRGTVTLAESPEWLQPDQASTDKEANPVEVIPAEQERAMDAGRQTANDWQLLSLMALFEQPTDYLGQEVRLVTWSGRSHQGRLQRISESQRLVLLQRHDANQVELHFNPLDVRSIEMRPLK
ncbi:hypothetical protein [Halopseudomonas salegens]|uniref:Uncharacterized protein n=1 Tax=Halopseudomonas salegens TaxID=1434072 RepID=A0A1H2FQ73_9GAMM|nr:hypothetical protein [Halopseudomonas salegens]SDU09465.1 hypothetical protein SAMN05216210_1723 [Halopseudomonas salegens]